MELNELYRDVILDHNRRPRNFGGLEPADACIEGFNPMCGDRLTLRLKLDDDKISDIRFEGQGCAISTASASLMTEAVKGRTRADALRPTAQVTVVAEDRPSYDATFERDELASLSYAVVDVETTGTSPWRGDRITEIAAIVVRDGVVAERFETLVNPERSIPPMITNLTQINWEMVKDAPR